MSKKLSGILLFLILIVNIIVIISVEIDRRKDDVNEEDQKIEVDKEDNEDEKEEEKKDEVNNNADDSGNISEGGLFIKKTEAAESENFTAKEKSKLNNILMQSTGRWIATDYVYGDITSSSWIVLRGDTLWEISEAKYGSGRQWTTILNQNMSVVRTLPNGQRALIVPGQILSLK